MIASDIFSSLTETELSALSGIASQVEFNEGDTIYNEGDSDERFFLLRQGQVALTIDKSGKTEVLEVLRPGNVFGEAIVFHHEPRSSGAVALSNTDAWMIERQPFMDIIESESDLLNKLYEILKRRNNEWVLKEQLVATTGVDHNYLHVSIKGDPSLRETAFTRDRHDSVVDKVLPNLIPAIRYMLNETVVYRVFVGLNNGEVRIASVINPFIEEVHTANKIVSGAYLNRHFPEMDYAKKCSLIQDVTDFIENTKQFKAMDSNWQHVLDVIQDDWRPVPWDELEGVIDQLVMMRKIPNFYLRNFSLSVAQDAVRMQFNCDGTHIVSTRQYHQFLEDNIVLE
jgi:hypothetical protein